MQVNAAAGSRPVYNVSEPYKRQTAASGETAFSAPGDKVEISPKGREMYAQSVAAQSKGSDSYDEILSTLQSSVPYMKLQTGSAVNTKNDGRVNTLDMNPKLLDKMQSDPAFAQKIGQRLKDVERAHKLVDSYMKATGSTVVCSHAYLDEDGNYCCFAITERKDEQNEELRAQAQENAEKLMEAVREKNKDAADRLSQLFAQAEEKGVLLLDEKDMKLFSVTARAFEEAQSGEADEAADEGETESESVGGCMGINAQKLARMLAAAKTRSQVQSVIAMIQSDIKECDQGAANGYDVDEASYKAAEQLLSQAKSQLASADNREATPQEEMMQAMASLM
ncbi:MAG: hypothetical protein IKR76_08630 [Ruminococcus sp.]|nr:hypothetical protein [Ruminococcus sp.]